MRATIESKFPNTPPMREFNVSNDLLGDRAALEAAWERDGYWFFRDVLEREAIHRLRAVYLRHLKEAGVVDPASSEAAIYNGASLESYGIGVNHTSPENVANDPLFQEHPGKQFVADPAIHKFFRVLIGDEPFWVPLTEYHAVPPKKDHSGSRFNYIHQDSSNNQGIPFKICWIPLAPIDEATGGLAVVEGFHRPQPEDFERPGGAPIPESVVPAEAWRRTDYRPGDILIFDMDLPHSGLANYSDHFFRLSLDIRFVPASGNVPTVGKVSAVDDGSVTVTDEAGESRRFVLDADTWCRNYDSLKIPLEKIPAFLAVGSPVVVASEAGRAKVIRPQH